MIRRTLMINIGLMLGMVATAQDPHFSQYFSSPMTLNPANTGNFEGSARLAGNYRNQWQGIGEPFLTGTASFDTEIMRERLGSGNRLAVGVLGLFDRTSGGMLSSSYISASVGYRISLDAEEKSRLSVGFQATMANRRLDYSRISFADQFSSFGFDLTLPSNQTFQTGNLTYLDWNTGLMYNYSGESGSVYAGVAAYHLTRPNESFLGNEKNRLAVRTTFHGGGSLLLGENGRMMFSGMLNYQGQSTEQIVGLAYGQRLTNEVNDIEVFLGSWYRVGDAVIPYVGYAYNNVQLGLSYDVTTSGLNTATTKNRSFELSFIYRFPDKSGLRRAVPWY